VGEQDLKRKKKKGGIIRDLDCLNENMGEKKAGTQKGANRKRPPRGRAYQKTWGNIKFQIKIGWDLSR